MGNFATGKVIGEMLVAESNNNWSITKLLISLQSRH